MTNENDVAGSNNTAAATNGAAEEKKPMDGGAAHINLKVKGGGEPSVRCRIVVVPGVDDQEYADRDPHMRGFDIDRPSSQIYPIVPTYFQWELAHFAAKYAAKIQGPEEEGGRGTPRLEFKQLVKANVEVVAGYMYYATFTAVDLDDGVEKIYRAKVWATVPRGLKCMYIAELKGCLISAQELRGEIVAMIEDLPQAFRPNMSDYPDDVLEPVVPPKVNYVSPTNKEVMVNGFCLLMKEFKERNPSWKHTRVRRAASRKWQSLSRVGKAPYTMEARKGFFRKRGISC